MDENMLRKILFICSLAVLTSCVGTIEETEKKVTDATIVKPVQLSFQGISKGMAVAHNKVQLYFKPVSGGSNNYSYLVYKDGNLSTPVSSIAQSELSLDRNGEYSVSVTGLVLGTNYNFLVRAFDSQYNIQDSNNNQISLATLAYKTPLFDGIQAIENLSGKEGESAILLKWNAALPATEGGGVFGGNADSISGYNIYLGDSEANLAFYTSVNDSSATSFKLSGLDSGKLFYVRVRAKNSLTVPVEDLNYKFLTKKTLTHLPIVFGGVSMASVPVTSAGFSNIKLQWNPGSGNYDRYKIFARKDPVSSFNQASSDYLMSTITDLSLGSAVISVPDAHTIWYVAVVACSDAACSESQGQNVVKYAKTSPPVSTFNGIKVLSQPLGGEGLSSLDITWDLPDITTGVYDEIRVFKSDAAGNFDPFLNRIDNLSYDPTNPLVPGVTLRSSTFVRVNGLETGKQSCFVAQAYSTSPIDPSNPDGRTALTRVVKCATPQYNIPGFAGVKLSCTNKTAKTFKISWDIPNPKGTFEDYEIYYKEGSSGFSIADALAGLAGYTKKVETSDAVSRVLTGLNMNSTYQVLVKSHYFNPTDSKDHRDNNSIIATCSTTAPLVEQGPWYELFAIGPKFDGLNGIFLAEKLTPLSGGVDGQSGASVNKPAWKHQYPVESASVGLGVSESINGIIRIAWDDMQLSDNLGYLREYNTTPNTGYKVYRLAHNALYGSAGPAISDNGWGDALNADLIQAPSLPVATFNRYLAAPIAKSVAQFVDYTLIHPYNQNSLRANEATVYWYKIEPWYNGKKLAYSSIASDAVVKMVLPPKNMAFIHRWMSNKQVCEDMGLPIQRSNNYKCEYTGLGAVLDADTKYYYDMKGDLLVDRFEMGCNFSRGGTADQCSNTGGYVGFEGNINDPATGRRVGDCVSGNQSSVYPSGKITAKQGAVFYTRASNECFVNTSNGVGTTWSLLSEIDGNYLNTREYYPSGVPINKVINSGLTKIPPTSAAVGIPASDVVPITVSGSQYAQYPQGLGYGAKIYSNDAKLPLLSRWVEPIGLHYTCQSSRVAVNGNTYLKRLSRRKEFVVYAAESPLLSPADRRLMETGQAQQTLDSPTAAPIKNYLTMPISEHNDRDCNVAFNMYNYYNPADGKMYYDTSFTSYAGGYGYSSKIKVGTTSLGQVTPGTVLNYNDPRWSTGGVVGEFSTLTTGSGGPLSTEACASRYGIQDAIGNGEEWTSDLFFCNPLYGCSMGYQDAGKTTAYAPPIDAANKENYKNPNGEYYSVTDITTSGAATVSMGTKLLPKFNYGLGVNRNFLTDFECTKPSAAVALPMTGPDCSNYGADWAAGMKYTTSKFFNVALGIPLDCEGSTCLYLGSGDSNTLVTPRTSAPLGSNALVTGYAAGSSELAQIAGPATSGNRSIYPSIVGIMSGGSARSQNADRYQLSLNPADGYMARGAGRCDVLLPENY